MLKGNRAYSKRQSDTKNINMYNPPEVEEGCAKCLEHHGY